MQERWWLAAAARDALGAQLEDDVASWMAHAAQGTVLSSDRSSAVVRLETPRPMIVKWRRPRPGRGRRTWLRASRELREARATRHLADLGIDAPPVWAVGERRNFGLLLGAVLLRPWIDDAADLRAAPLEQLAEGAKALRHWHELGFRHGDAYPKNVLRRGDGSLLPLGFPAARFVRAGMTTDALRLKDLAQWVVGVRLAHPETSVEEATAPYAEGADGPTTETWSQLIEPARQKIEAKKTERARTRAQREPSGVPRPVPLPVAQDLAPLRSTRAL